MTSKEEELLKTLDLLIDEKDELFYNAPINLSIQEFKSYFKEINHKISVASREYRMIKTPKFSEISDYGHIMSLEDFISSCELGWFIDYDGSGLYVRDNQESDIAIYPSDVKNSSIRTDFDTIIWFNR